MIVLLSPAKTLDLAPIITAVTSQPRLADQSEILLQTLRKMSCTALQKLLGVSDSLARLNHERYQRWQDQALKPAVLAYDGPAYKGGLMASTLTANDLDFAQQHLRILSGLYGLLQPLDLIRPYRLDMGTKLTTQDAKDLYAFWEEPLMAMLNKELGVVDEAGRFLVNCASQEYFKAVKQDQLACPVYQMSFPGPAVFAKQARSASKVPKASQRGVKRDKQPPEPEAEGAGQNAATKRRSKRKAG